MNNSGNDVIDQVIGIGNSDAFDANIGLILGQACEIKYFALFLVYYNSTGLLTRYVLKISCTNRVKAYIILSLRKSNA
jgi:hypothetical protein